MLKYLKRAWDLVVVCVRVQHVYELLRDCLEDL